MNTKLIQVRSLRLPLLIAVGASALIAAQPAFCAAPTVVAASGNVGTGNVTVDFSANVGPAAALNTANYKIVEFGTNINGFWYGTNDSVLAITGAAVGTNANEVVLNVTGLTAEYYTLRVKSVSDTATTTPIVTTNLTFWGDDPTVTPAAPLLAFPGIDVVVGQTDFGTFPPNVNTYSGAFGASFAGGPADSLPLWNSPNDAIEPVGAGPDGNNIGGVAQFQHFNTSEFYLDPPAFFGTYWGWETLILPIAVTNNGGIYNGAYSGVGPSIYPSATNLSNYKIAVAARLGGLNPTNGATSINFNFNLALQGPDLDTNNAGNSTAYAIEANPQDSFNVNSNWQTFQFSFSDPGVNITFPDNGTTLTNSWAENYNKFPDIKCNLFYGFFDTPNIGLDTFLWGYDGDNFIAATDYKLIYVDTSKAPPLKIKQVGANAIITVAAPDKLQTAASVNGPWVDVFDAVGSTYTNPATGNTVFFRSRAPLP